MLLGAFLLNVAFLTKVDERETLEAAAFAEKTEHARTEAHAKLLSEAEQEAIEAEALREAIAAPLLGTDGEDRSRPAPREESGAGRRDDVHARPHSNENRKSHHQIATTGVELPSEILDKQAAAKFDVKALSFTINSFVVAQRFIAKEA